MNKKMDISQKNKYIESHKNELIAFLKYAFQNTSIYLSVRIGDKDKLMPTVKYTIDGGYIIFVNKHRHLNLVAKQIPNYDITVSFEILKELVRDEKIILCEAGKRDASYEYTITLLDENFMSEGGIPND